MSNQDQPRVAKGTPKRGGQWSSKHTGEAGDVNLGEPAAQYRADRFGSHRDRSSVPPEVAKAFGPVYQSEVRDAGAWLRQFHEGDRVVLCSESGEEHSCVIGHPRLSDGQFGSWESYMAPASLGPGRYTWDVTAHRLAVGELGIRPADPEKELS